MSRVAACVDANERERAFALAFRSTPSAPYISGTGWNNGERNAHSQTVAIIYDDGYNEDRIEATKVMPSTRGSNNKGSQRYGKNRVREQGRGKIREL